MTEEFQVGDEIEWYNAKGVRRRGRVDDSGGVPAVRQYDDLGRLERDFGTIPASARRTSAVDLLAELVPDVYHLLGREAETCHCGGLDRDGNHLRQLDANAMHHAVEPRTRGEWSTLIRDTSIDLDGQDRSQPLADRPLPEGSADLAHEAKLCPECFRLATLAGCYPEEPMRQTEEALRKFVLAWMDRRIYSHLHCNDPSLLSMVFMCIALSPPMPQDYSEKVGLIYEFMDKAGPRAINGQPMFFSHKLLHADDWKRVQPVIEAEEDRRKNLAI